MSFGKDNSRLNNIGGNWTQRAKSHAAKKERKGGGGTFFWKGNYRPTEDPPGDIIRIFDGGFRQRYVEQDGETVIEDQLPYVFFREHRDSKDKSCICSAGPFWGSKNKADPCPSCELFWEDVMERRAKKKRGDRTMGPNRMSCTDRFAWMIYDYGPYTRVFDVDENGHARMNQAKNEPFTSWEKGHPNDVRFTGRVVEYKMGHLLPWVMPMTHKEMLMKQHSDVIGLNCKSCGNRNSIFCKAKVCAGCGAFIYDPNNNNTFTPEQRNQLDNNPQQCGACGQKGFLAEALECRACPNPVRQSIFDVDLMVIKQTIGEKNTILLFPNYSEVRPWQVPPEVAQSIQPIDMLARFAATSPEQQKKFMTLPAGRLQQAQQIQQQMPGFVPQGQGFPQGIPQGLVGQPFNAAQFGAPQLPQTGANPFAGTGQVPFTNQGPFAIPYGNPGGQGSNQ